MFSRFLFEVIVGWVLGLGIVLLFRDSRWVRWWMGSPSGPAPPLALTPGPSPAQRERGVLLPSSPHPWDTVFVGMGRGVVLVWGVFLYAKGAGRVTDPPLPSPLLRDAVCLWGAVVDGGVRLPPPFRPFPLTPALSPGGERGIRPLPSTSLPPHPKPLLISALKRGWE